MGIPDEKEYEIRYTTLSDLPSLQSWLSHPEDRFWFPISSEQEAEQMSKNWIGFYKYGASLTATYKGENLGIATLFLMPYRKVIHHCMIYFIVDPKMRKRGVGTSLVKNITHLGKSYFRFEWINAEIWEGCPGHSLLLRQGYQEIVRQEKYVKTAEGNSLSRLLLQSDCQKEEDGAKS